MSRLLASLGRSVALHYNVDQDSALALLEEFKENYMHAFGSKFVSYKADLGNYDEVSSSCSISVSSTTSFLSSVYMQV